MESYILFLIIAIATVSSPGPGVLLTLTNSIRYGIIGAAGSILGIAFGTFIVAGISATSLGIILATSSVAFSVMKYIGAIYLIYLGIKMWRSPASKINTQHIVTKGKKLLFIEAVALQLTNPKAVFFFMSIFPQFIDYSSDYIRQFMLLVVTYSSLVVVIHFLYAFIAKSARSWFASEKGGRIVNRLGGGTFMCFGLGLASANK